MPKFSFILIIIVVLIIIAVGLAVYFTWPSEEEIDQQPSAKLPTAPSKVLTPQELGAGEIGEVTVKDEKTGQEKPLVNLSVPPVIFNTMATVVKVSTDRLFTQGDGNNFADKTPRNITVIFTNSTLTFEKNQSIYYEGKEGLKHLSPGMRIMISSGENIRGKDRFLAKTVNIL